MKNKNLLEHFWDCITAKYFKFSGRASRSEFWGFMLFSITVGYLAQLADLSILRLSEFDYLNFGVKSVIALLLLIPRTAVAVRRFHDTNMSSIVPISLEVYISVPSLLATVSYFLPNDWKFYNAFPIGEFNFGFFGLIVIPVALYYLYRVSRKGDQGPNKYGPDPLNPELGNEIDFIGKE